MRRFCLLPLKVFIIHCWVHKVNYRVLFFHVFISALDFVLNKLCSLLCPFYFIPLLCWLHMWSQQGDGSYEAWDAVGTLGMY